MQWMHNLSVSLQYDDTQDLLSDLRQRYEQTEQEKRSINDELEQCKVNLKLLQEKGSNVSLLTHTVHLQSTKKNLQHIAFQPALRSYSNELAVIHITPFNAVVSISDRSYFTVLHGSGKYSRTHTYFFT